MLHTVVLITLKDQFLSLTILQQGLASCFNVSVMSSFEKFFQTWHQNDYVFEFDRQRK